MALSKCRIAALSAAIALGGCSFAQDTLFAGDGGQAGGGNAQGGAAQPASQSQAAPASYGADSGTEVGQMVSANRGKLSDLQASLQNHNATLSGIRGNMGSAAQVYHSNVAEIQAHLQGGTTPGNPVLTEKWKVAQSELSKIPTEIDSLNQLAASVESDSSAAAFLLSSIRSAYSVAGAVDQDHKNLEALEDETNQTIVLIERLLAETNADIVRQQTYVKNEQLTLNTLAMGIEEGEPFGQSLATKRRAAQAPQVASLDNMGGFGRRPLVVIRFDKPDVAYKQALNQAVGGALQRNPNSVFDVVAIAPARGTEGLIALKSNEARRHAESVMRSLSEMGLDASKVKMTSTTSNTVYTSEVHVFVR